MAVTPPIWADASADLALARAQAGRLMGYRHAFRHAYGAFDFALALMLL